MPTRVVPPPPRGLLYFAASAGALCGVVSSVATMSGVFPQSWGPWPSVAVGFGPVVLFVAIVASVTQRRSLVFLSAFCFVPAEVFVGQIAQVLLWKTDGGASIFSLRMVEAAIGSAVFGAGAGLLALGLRWFVRWIVVTFEEQDGSLCWRCGYRLGSPRIQRCPECGTPAAFHRYRFGRTLAPLWWACARSRVGSVALLVVLLSAGSWMFVANGGPGTLRFVRRIGTERGSELTFGWMYDVEKPSPYAGRPVPAVWRPFAGQRDHGLLVCYLPDDETGLPATQIWLGIQIGPADSRGLGAATPAVLCELDRAQADWVLRHGLPDPLVAGFQEADQRQTSTIGSYPQPGSAIQRIHAAAYIPATTP
jgi:hypothetical protein